MNLMPGGTVVKNFDKWATPDPSRGTRKVVQIQAGQSRTVAFDVGGWTNDANNNGQSDVYATAFTGYTTPGVSNGGTLKMTKDPTWTAMTAEVYCYNANTTYDGTTKSFTFNIKIDPSTTLDYYPVTFKTGIDNFVPYTGQLGSYAYEDFYVQVIPEPATLMLLSAGACLLVRRRIAR
jgi:hypothetical protein